MGYYITPGPPDGTPDALFSQMNFTGGNDRGFLFRARRTRTFPSVPNIALLVAPPVIAFKPEHDVVVHIRRCDAESEVSLSRGFYPALPLSYYVEAIDSFKKTSRCTSRVTEEEMDIDVTVLVVAPQNCWKSPLVRKLMAIYRGRLTLSGESPIVSSQSSNATVDFGSLRGARKSLVLSVGTFSWYILFNFDTLNIKSCHIFFE